MLACHLYLRSLASFTFARLLPVLLLTCCLYFCSLAAFTFARLLPSLLLAFCLYFCSLAAFTSARLLPLLLLACCLYCYLLALANLLCGFVKWLVVDGESIYLHFNVFFEHNLASHMPFLIFPHPSRLHLCPVRIHISA